MLLKGKLTNRSWAYLPEDIIRLIATHYLWNVSVSGHCPATWENKRLWPSKMVYMTIHDALDIEKHLMNVCPEWHRAVSKHLFWKQAIHVIDSNDTLIHHMVVHPKPQLNSSSNANSRPIYLTPYQHWKNIWSCSCHVCRINYPYSNHGLANAKRLLLGSKVGSVVYLCREHDRRRQHFCGLCLRDTIVTPHDMGTREYDLAQVVAIMENEDEKMWEGVDSTCKKCRTEWLLREAGKTPGDREAVGGDRLDSDDWETRQCVEGFIELAEGSIAEVLMTAREKAWLRKATKYEDFGEHALMAQRSSRDDQEEEEEDLEEDRDLMLMRDANQVRDLALHDWARRRILDGHWLCPADVWYQFRVPDQPLVVPAQHPCPWNSESTGEDDSDQDEHHPRHSIVEGEIPPTFGLCEAAFGAYMKQMKEILGHPMRNLVRKIIMECMIPTDRGFEDPGIKASRMTIEQVVGLLREEEGIWYDGVDWIERRRNEEEENVRRKLESAEVEAESAMRLNGVDDIKSARDHHPHDTHLHRYHDDLDSTTSSGSSPSASSNTESSKYSETTSPVLSTTTLQTTPSPPPLTDDGQIDKKDEEDVTPRLESHLHLQGRTLPSRPRIIPVDPVRSTPTPLSSIPFIPVTTKHLPQYSVDAIKTVWREACAPLYHCRCSICERAKIIEAAVAAAAYGPVEPPVLPSRQVPPPPQPTVRAAPVSSDANEIILKEVSEIELEMDGEGEDEVDYDGELEYEDDEGFEEDEDGDERYNIDEDDTYRISPEAEPPHADAQTAPPVPTSAHSDTHSNLSGHSSDTKTSRKRGSDELEADQESNGTLGTDDDNDDSSHSKRFRRRPDGTPPKRARLDEEVASSPVIGPTSAQTQVHFQNPPHTSPSHQQHTHTTTATVSEDASSIESTRCRKRSSEELSLDDEAGIGRSDIDVQLISSKRVKVDLERPRSLAPPCGNSNTAPTQSLMSSVDGSAVAGGGDLSADR
ncbi:hypothetical protein CPB83DRAFT_860348 [Crepidotus variabilis]|uniref:Uncharacterized protein n=1 Tax=Crepidotus variabilis TaxID=179855 RepID=A0A9P6E9V9_9AGAR|nr:hypothetical protein CPB83DRAFT_860348 [Crepidotus variabilis]